MQVRRDYTAEEILNLDMEEAWALPMGGLRIKFLDGTVLKLPTTNVITSWYYLRIFKKYPGAQIVPDYFHTGPYTGSTHNEMMDRVQMPAYFGHLKAIGTDQHNEGVFWDMARYAYIMGNWIFNDSALRLGKYTTTLSMRDFNETLLHPLILASIDRWKTTPNKDTFAVAWQEIHDILATHEDFKDNEIQKMIKSGTLNRKQLLQMYIRGYIMDSDGTTFQSPVLSGYGYGINSTYDRIIESRTAAIHLYMSTGPLEDSEYNNRVCQFFTGVIGELLGDDCGTEHYNVHHCHKVHNSRLFGKLIRFNDNEPWLFYLGSAPRVTFNNFAWPHYIGDLSGKTVQVRSITKCMNDDPTRPCKACLGLQSMIIPSGSAVGAQLTITPLGGMAQEILGIKHHIASPDIKTLDLDAETIGKQTERNQWLAYHESNEFFLKIKDPGKKNIELRPALNDAFFLNDIFSVDDIKEINPSTVAELSVLMFCEVDPDTGAVLDTWTVDTEHGGGGINFTTEFLEYLRDNPWLLTAKRQICISLDGWDFNKPAFEVPRRVENIMAILKNMSRFVEATKKYEGKRIVDMQSVEEAIEQLASILEVKLKVNYVHVEVFVRSHMVRGLVDDLTNLGWQLPIADEPFRFEPMSACIMNRGLGAALAFQGQGSHFVDPKRYLLNSHETPSTRLDTLWY